MQVGGSIGFDEVKDVLVSAIFSFNVGQSEFWFNFGLSPHGGFCGLIDEASLEFIVILIFSDVDLDKFTRLLKILQFVLFRSFQHSRMYNKYANFRSALDRNN